MKLSYFLLLLCIGRAKKIERPPRMLTVTPPYFVSGYLTDGGLVIDSLDEVASCKNRIFNFQFSVQTE